MTVYEASSSAVLLVDPLGMHAAHAVNGPTYAHAFLTTEEPLVQLST
jgi:hypothetical protein